MLKEAPEARQLLNESVVTVGFHFQPDWSQVPPAEVTSGSEEGH